MSRSDVAGRTNFGMLRDVLGRELADSSVRSQRNVQLVYQAFLKLNAKFTGDITETSHRCFPDEYFTCAAKCKVRIIDLPVISGFSFLSLCQSCEARCSLQMKHTGEHCPVGKKCIYSAQYENKIYTCRRCQVGLQAVHNTE